MKTYLNIKNNLFFSHQKNASKKRRPTIVWKNDVSYAKTASTDFSKSNTLCFS